MRRLAIFAHFDAADKIREYILYHLEALREVCDDVVFVSTARLDEAQLASVAPFCSTAYTKDNVGLDFGMWQSALARVDLAKWDEVVLTNSSVFGPVQPLAHAFGRMAGRECDFWAMTETAEHTHHLQTYFVVLRRSALASHALPTFFHSVLPYRDRHQVIRAYEMGLTTYLAEQGLRSAVLVGLEELRGMAGPDDRRPRGCNPTLYYPGELLRAGMPYVKVEVLRANPAWADLNAIYAHMEASGYSRHLVEFDRPVTAQQPLSIPARAVRKLRRLLGSRGGADVAS